MTPRPRLATSDTDSIVQDFCSTFDKIEPRLRPLLLRTLLAYFESLSRKEEGPHAAADAATSLFQASSCFPDIQKMASSSSPLVKGVVGREGHTATPDDDAVAAAAARDLLDYMSAKPKRTKPYTYPEDKMLGKGAFGSVFLSRDINGEPVIVKQFIESPLRATHFTNECNILKRLRHNSCIGTTATPSSVPSSSSGSSSKPPSLSSSSSLPSALPLSVSLSPSASAGLSSSSSSSELPESPEPEPAGVCLVECDEDKKLIVLQYLDGYQDLYTWIDLHFAPFRRMKRLSKDELNQLEALVESIYRIFKNAVEGLRTLHQLGLAHRDIKPENMLVHPRTLDVRFIDYDVACDDQLVPCKAAVANATDNKGKHHHDVLTTSPSPNRLGTKAYWPPEIALDGLNWFEEVAASQSHLAAWQLADIWSLGSTLFSLMSAMPLNAFETHETWFNIVVGTRDKGGGVSQLQTHVIPVKRHLESYTIPIIGVFRTKFPVYYRLLIEALQSMLAMLPWERQLPDLPTYIPPLKT